MRFILVLLTLTLAAVLSDAVYKTTITFYITCALLVVGAVMVLIHLWISGYKKSGNDDEGAWECSEPSDRAP